MNTKDFPIDLAELMDEMTDENGIGDRGYLSAIFYRQDELMHKYHDIESSNGAITIPLDNGPGGHRRSE